MFTFQHESADLHQLLKSQNMSKANTIGLYSIFYDLM